MKKLLFATTALIATVSMASAEIKFSGYGRFGVKGTDNTTTNDFKGLDAKSRLLEAQQLNQRKNASDTALEGTRETSRGAIAAANRNAAVAIDTADSDFDREIRNIFTFGSTDAAQLGFSRDSLDILFAPIPDGPDNEFVARRRAVFENNPIAGNTINDRLEIEDIRRVLEESTTDSPIHSDSLERASIVRIFGDAFVAREEADADDSDTITATQRAIGAAFYLADESGVIAEQLSGVRGYYDFIDPLDRGSLSAVYDAVEDYRADPSEGNRTILDNALGELGSGLYGQANNASILELLRLSNEAAAIIDTVTDARQRAVEKRDGAIEAANTAKDGAIEPANTALENAENAAAAATAAAAAARTAAQQALDNKLLAGLGAGNNEDNTDVTARYRVNIDIINETDNGVKFEGRVRLQGDNGSSATLNAPRFSVSNAGFRLDVGNVGGAIDNMPGYYGYEPGLTALVGQYTGVNFNFDGYSSTGSGEKNNFMASYAIDGFSAAVSYSDDGAGTFEYGDVLEDSEQIGVNLAWSTNALTFAAGYASASQKLENTLANVAETLDLAIPKAYDSSMYVLTAAADLGNLDMTLLFGGEEHDADPDKLYFDTFYGLSAQYQIGASTSLVFSYGDGQATFDKQSFGIGMNHDFGGAVLKAGLSNTKIDGEYNGVRLSSEDTNFDFGVQFNF